MTRRLLILLAAVGLWQIAYAQIHCALETAECSEGSCELCHLNDEAPLSCEGAAVSSPPLALHPPVAPNPCAPAATPLRQSRGRAPPP